MSTETSRCIAQRYISALSDPTGMQTAAVLSDSATVTLMTRSSELPLPTVMTGQEYVHHRGTTMRAFLPHGVRHEVRSLVAEDCRVAVETECFAELADGGTYNNRFHFAFEIRDEMIVAVREYADFAYATNSLFHSPRNTATAAKTATGRYSG